MRSIDPTVFLVLAVALTLPPFISLLREHTTVVGRRPGISIMMASAICPVAITLSFVGRPFSTGVGLTAVAIALSLAATKVGAGRQTVALGVVSMALYLHWGWPPA
ncbi:hypothetical protein [Pseudorhizobium pelagicum]|uniref:hypothetical protein n=1 Tax=Pseudorhizobium pelagicum TaxID=1509405 RepID=UPI000B182AE5|nr:hypothetical protein [Pseudorhizobium pelagicum]